jgi:ABC-type phosphate transport system permease subunit
VFGFLDVLFVNTLEWGDPYRGSFTLALLALPL